MSTYSEAWHNMDPDIRNFYRNWADRNCAQNWHVEWLEEYDLWWQFFSLGQSYPGYLGYHVAQRNWGIQLFLSGSFSSAVVLLHIPAFGYTGAIEPAYDAFGFNSYESTFGSIPEIAFNYPREKYRVRKSYWTGAPRRRRNL